MCTSLTLRTNCCLAGRNLDLEYHFGEQVVITPRGFHFDFRRMGRRSTPCAMIGMANAADGYPLYAEAMNEHGLYMAGLNFPGNAFYPETEADGRDSISPFELIPWVLSQCRTLTEARALLSRIHLTGIPFRADMPLTPLHWHLADRTASLTMEATADGIHLYDNPAEVLTNNPPFPFHLANLSQYLSLTAESPASRFSADTNLPLRTFGQGFGAIGLPGDFSPASRFVKTAFLRANAGRFCAADKAERIGQFFHILNAVAMAEGSVVTAEGRLDQTIYSCCIDADTLTYFYTTGGNQQITAVRLSGADDTIPEGDSLLCFPLIDTQQIHVVH